MTAPTISVALCTHNGARYVREQVESILRQSVAVTEVVLSDDASTDETVSIVEAAMAGSGIRLVVLQNSPALGVVANFEQATAACTGELIALCDQDDVWHEDKLARFVEELGARPATLLAHSDARLVTADLTPLPDSLLRSLEMTAPELEGLMLSPSYPVLLRRNLVTGATVLLRRELVEQARPFPPSWVHDEWLAIIAAALATTTLIDLELVDYRQHGGNQIGAVTPTLRYKFGKLLEPRTDRNERLVERARVLVERLEMLPVAPERLEQARRKLAHERFRNSLPTVRILRLPGIAAAVLAGRYGRYSRGIPDAVRDLVQPAR